MGARWFLRILGPKLELPSMSAYSPYLRRLWVRETIKRYDVTETYSHVVRQNLSETSITCAESC